MVENSVTNVCPILCFAFIRLYTFNYCIEAFIFCSLSSGETNESKSYIGIEILCMMIFLSIRSYFKFNQWKPLNYIRVTKKLVSHRINSSVSLWFICLHALPYNISKASMIFPIYPYKPLLLLIKTHKNLSYTLSTPNVHM